ncbi:MAG: putative lipid biosynthesis protein [Fluviicola sp.]|jgi:acetyltransferase-like isoleucine patch superfamily enzyme|uniref:acyltransferase n=1 Tax=Fluviicola sp. TaxID=1917219 RepID=UPI00261F7AB2|nr:acyltransferase [Fluviicola sp.]MDF3028626.1 putative lipid biosynthesis protein [Fluviicola sp.]
MGQKIGKKVRIRIGTLLTANDVIIENNVSIGPFCIIKTKKLRIGAYSKIQPLSIISTQNVDFRKHIHIAPLVVIKGEQSKKSSIILDDHSRVFPFCWIDTGHGVEIGKNVGIGGHTLIFTHGVWPNYLDGAGVSFGKVVIEDNVWIPWRVFILPNTHIGTNSIVGGNSLLNKTYPPNSLIGGSPAKIIKENIGQTISPEEKLGRFNEIIHAYLDYKDLPIAEKEKNKINLDGIILSIDSTDNLPEGAILVLLNSSLSQTEIDVLNQKGIHIIDHLNKQLIKASKSKKLDEFVSYLRRYGVRLYNK